MSRKPNFITFTGIDDRTDLTRADTLASKYPIEWGVLMSPKNQDARYPCKQAIAEILDIRGAKSAHLCGGYAKNVQTGVSIPTNFALFDRVQVNGYWDYPEMVYALTDRYEVTAISQTSRFSSNPNRLQLFDTSGGRGELPISIPPLPADGQFVGYAGGIGPTTVVAYLGQIEGDGEYWIDMEGRIRTNGWFDLDKVEKVCQLVYLD